MNLIYIGEDFYLKSGTSMSPLYTEDFKRSDWGKVNVALRSGETVTIRPATESEMKWAYEKLGKMLAPK